MIAIDQYGTVHHIPGKNPRKELLARLGSSKASKMYVDKKDGQTVCIGYVIDGLWLSLYSLVEF